MTTGSPYAVAPGRVRKPDGTPVRRLHPVLPRLDDARVRGPAGVRRRRRTGSTRRTSRSVKRHDPAELGGADPCRHAAARARRGRRAATLAGVPRRGGRRLRRRSEPAGSRRHQPDVAVPEVGLHPSADDAGRSGQRRSRAARRPTVANWPGGSSTPTWCSTVPESLWTSVDPVIDSLPWDDGPRPTPASRPGRPGQTGYPYIDAGMRQLLAEGWMHNRVRMGVASFLIKDLHLPWQTGAAHFLEHLVDGDYASNNHGWQWVAGSGPQASPFFRVFNPLAQGEKFDPQGDYVRHYVPELRGIAGKAVHRPWELGRPDVTRAGTRSRSSTTPPSGRRRCGAGRIAPARLRLGAGLVIRAAAPSEADRAQTPGGGPGLARFEPAQADAGVERVDRAGHRLDRDGLALVGLSRPREVRRGVNLRPAEVLVGPDTGRCRPARPAGARPGRR